MMIAVKGTEMTDYAVFAQKALNDEVLSRQECRALLNAPDDDLLEVLQAAYLVRSRYCEEWRVPGGLPLLLAIGGVNGGDRTIQFIAACADGCGCAGGRRVEGAAVLYCHQRAQPVGSRD
jgi:hypothetical protein